MICPACNSGRIVIRRQIRLADRIENVARCTRCNIDLIVHVTVSTQLPDSCSPFEERLWKALRAVNLRTGGNAGMTALLVELGLVSTKRHTIYYWLRKLEASRLVERPDGARGGWRACLPRRAGQPMAALAA